MDVVSDSQKVASASSSSAAAAAVLRLRPAAHTLVAGEQALAALGPTPFHLPLGPLAPAVAGAFTAMPKGEWVVAGPRTRVGVVLRGCPPRRLTDPAQGARPYKLAPESHAPGSRALHAVGLALGSGKPVLCMLGLASAAIPLIIHLSRSRRTKKIRFSTTRFLTDQFLRSYRMSRLKELLLLAARMALCALFAMALAQPFLTPDKRSLLTGQHNRTIVLVLDNSASMAYRENDVTLFEQARTAALEVLQGLNDGDRVSVVLAGRRHPAKGPEVLFDKPTPELGDVRQALETLQVSELSTDLSQAIWQAEQIVQSGSADGSREIYVLSDLQNSGREMPDADQVPSGQADVNLFLVSVRPRQASNLAVTAVQYAASRPMVGIPFSIRPHIRNHSANSVGCDVELFIDDKKVGAQRIETIQAGRWSVPTLHHTFASGGWHSGYVQVKDPSLESDNRRYFAFEVLDSVKVIAVNGAFSSVKRLDELFFLKAALRATAAGQSPIDVSIQRPADFADAELTNVPLVILANVESLPPQAIDKLEVFVDQGGSLLVFLGDKVNSSFYNQTFTGSNRMHGGLLPGRLAQISGNPGAETPTAAVGDIAQSSESLAASEVWLSERVIRA